MKKIYLLLLMLVTLTASAQHWDSNTRVLVKRKKDGSVKVKKVYDLPATFCISQDQIIMNTGAEVVLIDIYERVENSNFIQWYGYDGGFDANCVILMRKQDDPYIYIHHNNRWGIVYFVNEAP